MENNSLDIQVQRIYKLANNQSLKAFADISVNDALLIKSIRVVNGKNGLFVSMPQEQSKDKKWYDSVRCLTKEIREQIMEAVLAAYEAENN
jgi:stage V sporulation protein G